MQTPPNSEEDTPKLDYERQPRASEFKLASVQAVIFTPEVGDFSQVKVLTSILNKYDNRFDGDMQAIALPADAPAEVPRIVLQSNDGVWRLTASPTRVDSYWVRPIEETERIGDDIVAQCSQVLVDYVRVSKFPVKIGRVALVLSRFYETSNPARLLIDRFSNDDSKNGPFVRSRAFEIHNQKRYTPQSIGLEINSWVRCKSVVLLSTHSDAVLVEQDLNTPDEQMNQNSFDADDIEEYYQQAESEANSILRVYFPEEK